jgi:hypothetical protein
MTGSPKLSYTRGYGLQISGILNLLNLISIGLHIHKVTKYDHE